MDEQQRGKNFADPIDCAPVEALSIASLFHQACREMAQSDARIYRSVGQHIARTKEILRQAEAGSDFLQLVDTPLEPLSAVAPTYDRQTRKSLENLCKAHGISGYSRLNKSQMISLLQANKIAPPPVPMEALTKAELIELLRKAMYQFHNNVQQ